MSIQSFVVASGDVPLAVRVHRPDGDPDAPLPAVVVTGSWLTVKEQMPDHYAAALAARGYLAVTFDFAGFGASGGALRQTELPLRKAADLAAVVSWVSSLSSSSPGGPAVVAVCASAQYAVAALAAGCPASAFVSVAGWFHDGTSVASFYGGAPGVAQRLQRASDAADRFSRSGELDLVPAYAANDDRAGMFVEMDYYANPARGAIPEWRNEMSELTWGHWLTFDGLAAARAVSTPSLFVHSDGCVFPDNLRKVAADMSGPVDVAWGDGEQTDYYDRPAQVQFAVDAIDAHLRTAIRAAR